MSSDTMQYNSAIRKERNNAICSTMDGPRECPAEWVKPDREAETLHDVSDKRNLKRNDARELIYKMETDSQI